MKKAIITIRTKEGTKQLEGYTFDYNGYTLGVHKTHTNNKKWNITDIRTGLAILTYYDSRKEAVEKAIKKFDTLGTDHFNKRMKEAFEKYAL